MSVFLSAEWRDLAMLNFAVPPELLLPHVPKGTELDFYDGVAYASLVGFRFLNTRLGPGIQVPFHTDFDEVNLRFYVRREVEGEVRRGVTFIAEIVPKWAVAAVARLTYGEKYLAAPMCHERAEEDGLALTYEWGKAEGACRITAKTNGAPASLIAGSLPEFIAEHYWGYSSLRGGGTVEYQVEHEPWKVYTEVEGRFEGDPTRYYGPALTSAVTRPPDFSFVALGSPVRVLTGKRIA